jgi:hypothetical protein
MIWKLLEALQTRSSPEAAEEDRAVAATVLSRSSLLVPLHHPEVLFVRTAGGSCVPESSSRGSRSQSLSLAADGNSEDTEGWIDPVGTCRGDWTDVCLQCWQLALQLLADEDVAVRYTSSL